MADWFEQNAPKPAAASPRGGGDWFDKNAPSGAPDQGSPISRFASEFAGQVNPVPLLEAADRFQRHPIDTAVAALGEMGRPFEKAKASVASGDYISGVRHAIGWLLPMIGPTIDDAGDQAANGDIAGGLGKTSGAATAMLAGPKVPGMAVKVAGAVPRVIEEGAIHVAAKLTGVPAPVMREARAALGDRIRALAESRRAPAPATLPPDAAPIPEPAPAQAAPPAARPTYTRATGDMAPYDDALRTRMRGVVVPSKGSVAPPEPDWAPPSIGERLEGLSPDVKAKLLKERDAIRSELWRGGGPEPAPVASRATTPPTASLPAPEPVVQQPAAPEPPPANQYRDAARGAKAQKLADVLQQYGIAPDDVPRIGDEHWKKLSKAIGVKEPSADTRLAVQDILKQRATGPDLTEQLRQSIEAIKAKKQPTAVNTKTGARVQWDGKEWQPTQ